MEKPDLFRTGIFVWLVLLSVGDIWQFNAIKKLSLLQTTNNSRDSSYEHQHEYQHDDDVIEREIHVADISHDDVELEFHAKHHNNDVEHEPHAAEENMALRFRQNERTLRKNHNVRENMNLSRLSVQKFKRKLDPDFSIREDTNGKDAEQKNIFQNTKHNYSFRDFNTTCVLLNNDEQNDENDIDENDFIAEFFLDFKIRTDAWPEHTSWYLSPQHDNNNMVIDSLNENATANLSALTLHKFEYHCVVVSEEDQKKEISEPFCYDFYLHDSADDGICCRYGLGYFELNINNSTNAMINDRIYTDEIETPFCIDNSGSLADNKQLYDENESNHIKKYPSRECINDTCVCDSNPPLFVRNDDNLHANKLNVMFQMMSLSGSEKLMDINTPQYKAACWILKDDPYFTQHNVSSTLIERIEERMIQRYILAVFYFATTGEKWTNNFGFLSARSECEWNSMDDFYDYDYEYIGGSICDEDENVMSIVFVLNNLDGTIIEELYGLTKLEQLYLETNENLRGSIPSSLGRLSELRDIILFDSSLQGSIPPELFRATNMQAIDLARNNLSSSIPENIGIMKKLTSLHLFENKLTGSIPESMYSLTSLAYVELDKNDLSSTISPSISNMKRLRDLWLSTNNLTGEIPSSIKHLSRLEVILLNNNELSGEIPSGLESLSNLFKLSLHNNRLNGAVSDDLCDSDYLSITTDCRNDVFAPNVSCSCCDFCTDLTPQRNGECADTSITIEFDHKERKMFHSNSDDLEWSLIDQSTGQVILYDGPYHNDEYNNTRPSYTACVVNTGCYSLIMKSPPKYDTNYTIFWNDDLILSGTFLEYWTNDEVYKNYTKTMVTFQYDHEVEEFIFHNTTCNNVQLTCGNKDEIFFIEENTIERLLYSTAVEISGMSQLQNTSSFQSKALCWIMQHENYIYNNADNDLLQTRFTQRYVLTILHLMSFNGLFGPNEYPPLSDECDWEGIQCKDNNTKIVTAISLSPSKGQIIGGPLIDEIGNLAFVEVLRLNQTELTGTLPLMLSNMWSLVELDLSSNLLSSSIPDTFFNQLTHLKYLNLSNNTIISSIPNNIGSYSEIKTLILNRNQFTGSIPHGNFKSNDLEHFEISENKLSSINLSLLLKHKDLHTINLATNFFVGELKQDIFVSLPKLQYFNISQNEIGGVIPSRFPYNSNITHLDVHSNRFKGTIPQTLSDLHHLQHLNLQGNRLTGSIPSQLNKLKSLKLMALSNNDLKGSISIDLGSLPDLESLYLHNNKLSGAAPEATKKMRAYTTDCGYPSVSSDPIGCPSCSICCNSDNLCAKQRKTLIGPVLIAVIFILSLLLLMTVIYAVKQRIMNVDSISNRFEKSVSRWKASETIGDKSVYHFFLTPSVEGWFIGLFCAIAQLATLFLFINSADITSESSDLKYTMTCPKNSLECDDKNTVSVFGYFIFSLILFGWLTKDIIASIKLFMLAIWEKNIDFFFASMILFLVTSLSIWTSAYYNIAVTTKDTDLIIYSVILLFVNELDERLFLLVQTCNLSFAGAVEESIQRASYHEGRELIVTRGLNKVRKRLYSLGSSIVGGRSNNNANKSNSENKKDPVFEDPMDDKRDVLQVHSDSSIASYEKSIS